MFLLFNRIDGFAPEEELALDLFKKCIHNAGLKYCVLSPVGMIIRDCSSQDLGSVEEIETASFDDPYPRELFCHFLDEFPHGFRVAVAERVLSGYCIVISKKDKGVIASLAVRPDQRRRHIGKELLLDAIELCRTKFSLKLIELQVRSDNKGAISLYSNSGFSRGETINNYYGPGRDGLYMALKLS